MKRGLILVGLTALMAIAQEAKHPQLSIHTWVREDIFAGFLFNPGDSLRNPRKEVAGAAGACLQKQSRLPDVPRAGTAQKSACGFGKALTVPNWDLTAPVPGAAAIEELVKEIDGRTEGFELWVPDRFTLGAAEFPHTMGMEIFAHLLSPDLSE